jgi:hypothetical protein
VPYLFWALLALASLTRAIARAEPRRLRRVAVFAALSVATKDQGYALFALGMPLALASWFAFDIWPRENAKALAKEVGVAAAIGAGLLLVLDGAVFNPSGFRARLAFLSGPASQPHANYSADPLGRLYVTLDSVAKWNEHYPLILAPLVVVGLAVAALTRDGRRRAAALVPMLAAISFTLAFNCVARRTEHRFLMPQMVLWSVYGGIGLETLLAAAAKRRDMLVVARLAVAAAFAYGLFRCAAIDANLLLDPRYDAEAWLEGHTARGDVVEVEGKSVYLPRLPAKAHVVHIGRDPIATRNPILGAEEKVDRLDDVAARAPRFIVVNFAYAAQSFDSAPPGASTSGRVPSGWQTSKSRDSDASSFFHGLFDGRIGYRVAHISTWTSELWPRIDLHASISRDIFIFERSSDLTPAK